MCLFRTYYEKKILVPVPKTGLYPKKLVYKFGPNAVSPSHSKPVMSGKVKSGKHLNNDKVTAWKSADYEMVSDAEGDD